jgi:hypothetical protein
MSGYISIGIHATHVGMTKFASPSDPGFVAVCGELHRWVRSINGIQNALPKYSVLPELQPSNTPNTQDGNVSLVQLQSLTRPLTMPRASFIPFPFIKIGNS